MFKLLGKIVKKYYPGNHSIKFGQNCFALFFKSFGLDSGTLAYPHDPLTMFSVYMLVKNGQKKDFMQSGHERNSNQIPY